jgi:hypothetical protein
MCGKERNREKIYIKSEDIKAHSANIFLSIYKEIFLRILAQCEFYNLFMTWNIYLKVFIILPSNLLFWNPMTLLYPSSLNIWFPRLSFTSKQIILFLWGKISHLMNGDVEGTCFSNLLLFLWYLLFPQRDANWFYFFINLPLLVFSL